MKNNKEITVVTLLVISLVAIFTPDLGPTSRFLAVKEDEAALKRKLQIIPPGMTLSCPTGMEVYQTTFYGVDLTNMTTQTITLDDGMRVTVTLKSVGSGTYGSRISGGGYPFVKFSHKCDATDFIDPLAGVYPSFPADYVSVELLFDRNLPGAYISIGDIDSMDSNSTEAARIFLKNAANSPVLATYHTTGTLTLVGDYAYGKKGVNAANPGFSSALYAMSSASVRRAQFDMSGLCFNTQAIGKYQARAMQPALDFAYCIPSGPSPAPTPAPTQGGGHNGDPLIMGLSGQLFQFDGRSGGWYSAISAPSFQWNMKVHEFKNCPANSNNFVSGVGLTFKNGSKKRTLEINIVNEDKVDVGCSAEDGPACLGAGSLELIIDGVKHVTGGDYTFKDGSGRIFAFNTFYQCSRKWYDFDVRPSETSPSTSLRTSRRLDQPEVFHVIDRLKKTMIDEKVCNDWLDERKKYSDLFNQPGRYSTIIIETADITLHMEYKQEDERCDAHSIDVWISSVDPALLDETWEGVIGETKTISLKPNGAEANKYSRMEVLKFADDADYEVSSALSTSCKGCSN